MMFFYDRCCLQLYVVCFIGFRGQILRVYFKDSFVVFEFYLFVDVSKKIFFHYRGSTKNFLTFNRTTELLSPPVFRNDFMLAESFLVVLYFVTVHTFN